MRLFDLEAIRRFLVEVAQHYAQSAPDISDWAGELYELCSDDWRSISLDELRTAEWLQEGDALASPTLAEQTVSRLLQRQSRLHGGETGSSAGADEAIKNPESRSHIRYYRKTSRRPEATERSHKARSSAAERAEEERGKSRRGGS